MDSVALWGGIVKLIESQKEVFYCSSPAIAGTVVEDMIVWTFERNQISATVVESSSNTNMITDCTKGASDAGLFSASCASYGPFDIGA